MFTSWIEDFHQFYRFADANSDPRTSEWPLVKHFQGPVVLILVYLTIVLVGPKLMGNRKPFQLKWPMAIYNAAMTILNLYIFIEVFLSTMDAGYSYSCQEVKYTDDSKELRIAAVLWWFYLSKILEFLDTIFFILRKKNNQISFLHVYHHSSMVMLWWIGIKWVAGGQSFFSAMINSFIHVIMYTYYGLSVFPALRDYLWWKKFLTQFQLLQFCTVFCHGIVSLKRKCKFPLWMQYALLAYMVSFLVLFSNFYLHSYIVKNQHSKKSSSQCKQAKTTKGKKEN
ncbi:elongation of very long chain fatty acids protein 4-like [Actinia tenebrosa]|uniref:Elongation of very long chain fatty acids protein n=1 Tax=Actinia tenebrosa TaxID=6105 RepID=A0A6P8ITM5_ACTTE|nr:elongation of very long chain fatty acids protein 4-like [Actinia tenebrosa]